MDICFCCSLYTVNILSDLVIYSLLVMSCVSTHEVGQCLLVCDDVSRPQLTAWRQ